MALPWLTPPIGIVRTIEASIGRFRGGFKKAFPWQVGASHIVTLDVPLGYTIAWEIIESNSESVLYDARSVVESGTDRQFVLQLGSFTSHTDYSGLVDGDGLIIAYDLKVTITNGVKTFSRRFRRMIEMTPKTPTEGEATQVINLDTYSGNGFLDYALADKTAHIIYFKGTKQFSGNGHAVDTIKSFIFAGLRSTDPNYPVHIFFQPGLIMQTRNTGSLQAIKVAEQCQYVYLNGGSDWENPVTLEWGDNIGSFNYLVYIQLFNSSTSLANGVRNITFQGFTIDGYSTTAAFGGGGLTINNPASQGVNTYSNWAADGYEAFQGFKIFNVHIRNVTDEGVYAAHFQDSDGYPGLNKCAFHHISCSHVGNESLQMAMCYNSEIHDCYVVNTGYKNTPSHNNGFQINGGNNTAFYRNKILGMPQTANLQNGEFGDNTYVFANVFENKTVGATGNIFIRLEQQAGGTTNYQFVQNTIICPDGTANVTMYIAKSTGGVTTEFDHLDLCNNLAVSSNASRYGTLNSPSLTNVYGLGLHGGSDIPYYLATNIATPGFVDHANSNYKLASLGSPAFTPRSTVFTPGHPLMEEDHEGVEFINDVHGAYSGYELMT